MTAKTHDQLIAEVAAQLPTNHVRQIQAINVRTVLDDLIDTTVQVPLSPSITGRISSGPGDPENLTGTQVTSLLDQFTASLKGLVPASGGGNTTFLRADGTWQIPPGGGGGGTPGGTSGQVQFNNAGNFGGFTLSGDATLNTGTGVITVANGVISYAKIQNVSNTSRFLGRITAGSGSVEELTGTQATTLLDTFSTTTTAKGTVTGSNNTNLTTAFLRADGTWQVPPGGGSGAPPGGSTNQIQFNAGGGSFGGFTMSGDATLVVGTGVITISGGAVTYSKIQNVSATSRFLGRITTGAGVIEELTGTQATSLLDLFSTTTTTKGLVTGSNNTNLTTAFLRADGTWQIPPGGGGGTPGGAPLTIQFNNTGVFGGMSGTSWDDANRALTITGTSITANRPILSATQTWASLGTTFVFENFNVTDTQSAVGSLFTQYQVGGVTKWSVRKDGTVTTGIWGGTSIGATVGGTGQNVYTIGDILTANTTTTLAKLNDAATGNALISGGAGVIPSWGKIGLGTHVSGNLPVTNLNSGVAASSSTYWRGDGQWATLPAFLLTKNQIPNIMDYGAVRTDSSNPTDMTNTTAAFAAAWAAAPRGLIYAPAGTYRINGPLTVPNNIGAGILGDGGVMNGGTTINSILSTGDVLTVPNGDFNIQGLRITRTLTSGFPIGSTFAATSGAGINITTAALQGYMRDIELSYHYNGLLGVGAVFASLDTMIITSCASDGFLSIETGGLSAQQWNMDNIFIATCGGKGFHFESGSTHSAPTECMTRLATYLNRDVGFYANGLAAIRLVNCFFGNDLNQEVFIGGAGSSIYPHVLTNVYVELAGQTSTPWTPATLQASGFFINSDVACDVSLVNCSAVGCTLSGVIFNTTTNLQVHGGGYNANGTLNVGGNNFGINLLKGSASIIGVNATANASSGFSAIGAVTNLVTLGNKGTISSAAASNYSPVGANY